MFDFEALGQAGQLRFTMFGLVSKDGGILKQGLAAEVLWCVTSRWNRIGFATVRICVIIVLHCLLRVQGEFLFCSALFIKIAKRETYFHVYGTKATYILTKQTFIFFYTTMNSITLL